MMMDEPYSVTHIEIRRHHSLTIIRCCLGRARFFFPGICFSTMWFISICFSDICTAQQTLHITIPSTEKTAATSSIYYSQLLRLALTKTESTDGPFDITEYPQRLTVARNFAEVKRKGFIDLVWSVTNSTYESELLPIRISLLKDLNSYRIFLIRSEDQKRFDQVNSLDDLRRFTAGQGSHWPDTEILQANDLPVITSVQFESLFPMLITKRFDYFPRGLDEIWNEEKLFTGKGLSIEQHLMLHYPSPKYFFVNKSNKVLADRIERGLKIAIADGSFDTLFNSIPGYQRGYEEISTNKRRVFTLHVE
jgi:hypothetical protein